MLEPVSPQHSGFRVPGLSQDGRGVVVGSEAILVVYGIDRLVSALRLLSEEPSLADLLPSLRLEEVKNALGARGYLLRFRCGDSRTLDRCARAATLALGSLCVGSERHFVLYRDRRAPLGYDASALHAESGDYVLYTAAATQAYQRVADLPLLALLRRLSPLPTAGGRRAALRQLLGAGASEVLWLLVPGGLVGRVLRYLWQRGVTAAAALPDSLPEPGRRPQQRPASEPALVELRLDGSGTHVELLLDLPGVRALLPLGDALAVELGYTHPIRLSAFERLFERDRRYLFLGGERPALDVPAGPFVPAARLVELDLKLTADAPAAPLRPTARGPAFAPGAAPLKLALRLTVEPTPGEVPTATLVPWSQARRLGQLLGLLPPPLFRDLQAVAIDEGVLIVGDSSGVAGLALGRLFYAAAADAPTVLVPLGMALVPRLRGELLAAAIEGAESGYVLFLPDRPPLRLGREHLLPVSRQLVARLRPEAATTEPADAEPSDGPRVVNDSLGLLFPLWGGLPPPLRLDGTDEEP